ncbi:MAG: tRNA guanosine(34) transglycosylase Tgt [Nanoarchaeota archaeon]
MFSIIAREKAARAGILETMHGSLETPAFMPVNTKGVAKFVTRDMLYEMGVQAVISNSFILYLTPGLDIVGDLHDFMNFKRVIFTDCGAFQMLRDSFYLNHTNLGIRFKNPFNGKRILLTPAEVMRIQTSLNSDVAMALDNLQAHGKKRPEFEKAVELTLKWHEECLQAHRIFWPRLQKKRQLVFGIGQGGLDENLRRVCMKKLVQMDFDGYAIGGLCIGEKKEEMYRMTEISIKAVPNDKPVYLMGVGSPEDVVKSISLGVDIFDSAYPTQLARHNTLFTWDGYLKISALQYKDDSRPPDPACNCMVCRNFSRKYLRHLVKVEEPTAHIYKSYHNLYFLQALVGRCREEIKKETFTVFAKAFLKKYQV